MVSRALRIFGLLLLISGTAAAHGESRLPQRDRAFVGSDWAKQLSSAGSAQRAPQAQARPGQTPERDATGRVWSHVQLGQRGSHSAGGWTTQRFGSWSYSYSSDGTRCVSQRTAQSVLIRCQ